MAPVFVFGVSLLANALIDLVLRDLRCHVGGEAVASSAVFRHDDARMQLSIVCR